MRNFKVPALTLLSVLLLAGILSGIQSSLLYLAASMSLIFLIHRNPIHFIWLMIFDALAIYELNNPSTIILDINYYHSDIFIVAGLFYLIRKIFSTGLARFPKEIRATFILFVVVVSLGVFNGLINGVAVRNLMRELSSFGRYLAVPIAVTVFKTPSQIKIFAKRISWLGIAMAVLGISMRLLRIENVSGFPGSSGVSTAFGMQSRAYGLSGGTSLMVASLFLLMSSGYSIIKSKFGRVSALILNVSQLLLLFARSLILGVASGFAVLAIVSGAKRAATTFVIVTVSILSLYAFSSLFETDIGSAVSDRYLSIVSTRFGGDRAQANIEWRKNELEELWEALNWTERIIGVGMGSRLSITILDVQEVPVFHNSYANCIQKIGLVGLFAYVIFLFSIIRVAIRLKVIATSDTNLYHLGIAFIATFIALAIWGSGAMGMPLNANLVACLSLGIFIRVVLILRRERSM